MSLTVTQMAKKMLPEMLSNSGINVGSASSTEYNKKLQQPDKAELESAAKSLTKAYKKGDYADFSQLLKSSSKRKSYTAETAAEAMAQGVPTHSFFYQDIDALAQVASDPDKTLDTSFAEDTLDFFTGGNYTKQDVDKLQSQMSAALKELSQQLEDTGKVDAGKLKSRMTINGAEVSLGELADFQMMGQKLAPAFDSISSDTSRFEDMQSMAKMSIARLMGRRYGENRGEIGSMFSSAIEGLYDKGMDQINRLYTDAQGGVSNVSQYNDTVRRGNEVTNMFSRLDTTNKSTLAYDFNRKISTMREMMNQQYTQFGTPALYRNANAAAKNVGMFFSTVYEMMT